MPSKILIVDDSATVREQLRECLETAGYSVTQAQDGAVGLQTAIEEDFDLILVDLNMPVMGGLEMTERLRQESGKNDIPLLILTVESSRELIQRGKDCGVTAWVIKPFREKFLLQGIGQVLKVAAGP